jgi:hypothetical protein
MKPYPVIYKAEQVINWREGTSKSGEKIITQVITQSKIVDESSEDEFHPDTIDEIKVHELNEQGNYQIRIFRNSGGPNKSEFVLYKTQSNIIAHNKPIKRVPVFPLNGSLDIVEPLMTTLIAKEIALYNKVSRRNHLLYGACTYTPVIKSDMGVEDFDKIVSSGLGTWIQIGPDDDAFVLKTPTDALKDLDRAIQDGIEEMARLGVRMMAPEAGNQSGVALQIRSANQNVSLASLSVKISDTMSDMIAFMVNWYEGTAYTGKDIKFKLNDDFSVLPLGMDYLKLATEWYERGLIPRSIWLNIIEENEMIPPTYNDEEGQEEINSDEIIPKNNEDDYNIES